MRARYNNPCSFAIFAPFAFHRSMFESEHAARNSVHR